MRLEAAAKKTGRARLFNTGTYAQQHSHGDFGCSKSLAAVTGWPGGLFLCDRPD